MDRLYGKLYNDNTFILHGNKSLITGYLNKNNTIGGVSYQKLKGHDKSNNKSKYAYDGTSITMPILEKTPDNQHLFGIDRILLAGVIENDTYGIITIEKNNPDISKWAFVRYKDLELNIFNFVWNANIDNNLYHEYVDGYYLYNKLEIYNNNDNIGDWLYITLDNIDTYTYDFKYLFMYNITLTCYTKIDEVIIFYENGSTQIFKIKDVGYIIGFYLKCEYDIKTIVKIYLKLSKLDFSTCINTCGEYNMIYCDECDVTSECDKCGGNGYIIEPIKLSKFHDKDKIGFMNSFKIYACKYYDYNQYNLYE